MDNPNPGPTQPLRTSFHKISRTKRLNFIVLTNALLIVMVWMGYEFFLRRTATHIKRQHRETLGDIVQSDSTMLINYTPKGRRLIPGAHVVIQNHFLTHRDIRMDINSLGFRGKEIAIPKPAGVYRILVLGDSITWADYLEEDETFCAQLETELNKNAGDKRFEVINAGVGDIGLNEEVDILEERGMVTQPDVVLVAHYLNDSRPPWGFPGELGAPGWMRRHSLVAETIYHKLVLRRWIEERGLSRGDWATEWQKNEWVNDHVAFMRLVATAQYDWGSAWYKSAWDMMRPSFERLDALAKEGQFKVVFAAFPVACQVYASFVEDSPQDYLRKTCHELEFRYIDLLPALRKKFAEDEKIILYHDQCHPTAAGHALIGGLLAAEFQNSAAAP